MWEGPYNSYVGEKGLKQDCPRQIRTYVHPTCTPVSLNGSPFDICTYFLASTHCCLRLEFFFLFSINLNLKHLFKSSLNSAMSMKPYSDIIFLFHIPYEWSAVYMVWITLCFSDTQTHAHKHTHITSSPVPWRHHPCYILYSSQAQHCVMLKWGLQHTFEELIDQTGDTFEYLGLSIYKSFVLIWFSSEESWVSKDQGHSLGYQCDHVAECFKAWLWALGSSLWLNSKSASHNLCHLG